MRPILPESRYACADTYAAICDDFILADRGAVDIKGFGSRRVYELRAEAARRR